MFIIKKREIKEVRIIKKINDLGQYEVEILSTNVRELHPFENVYFTHQEAEMVLKEITKIKDYKKRRRNKQGLYTCACCGTKSELITVDHITPLKDFGGRRNVRKDINLWNKAWSFNNFQLLCEECNQFKDDKRQDIFLRTIDAIDKRARELNNSKKIKKNVNVKTPANKIGYGIATSKYADNKKDMAEYFAKADSNILRLDMILDSKEAYDLLPSTF